MFSKHTVRISRSNKFHPRGIPTIVPIPADFPRNPRDYHHPVPVQISTLGSTRHGGRQETGIYLAPSRQYGNCLLGVRHQEEEESPTGD